MSWEVPSIVAAAVAAAVNAGAFFAFSNFVMPALAELRPTDGATAMQSINRFAPNPLFVFAIVGAGVVAIPALFAAWGEDRWGWLAAAVGLSLVSFVITIAFNVPRNDALEAASPADLASVWSDYLVSWTRWNTVRTVTSAASVATFALSLRGR